MPYILGFVLPGEQVIGPHLAQTRKLVKWRMPSLFLSESCAAGPLSEVHVFFSNAWRVAPAPLEAACGNIATGLANPAERFFSIASM
jgi:hypothetical protein